MRISLAVSAVMLAGKLTAWLLTHSTALLADAAESVVHGAATGLAAFSLWLAAQPADESHPYGHGRIAYFSAGFEGALVLAAAGAVIWSAIDGLVHPPALQRLGTGLGIAAGLAAINLGLGLALIRVGKKHNALILTANGHHVLSDVWTTGAAILGVALVLVTNAAWLDPVAALVIGALIMVSGAALVRTSFRGLMDRVDPALGRDLIEELDRAVREGRITAFHQLRCRRLNDEIWIDVHLLVPGALATVDAHHAVTDVEEAVRRRFAADRVHMTSHIEPAEHEVGHPDGHAGVSEPLRSDAPAPPAASGDAPS
ncbi:MAG: cation transporter [Planctomycetes bacterium]|nr:cation transporter [Planctomycetota bacterium]